MPRVNTPRMGGTPLLNSLAVKRFISRTSTPGTHVQEKLETQGWRMPPQALPFLVNNCYTLTIHALARFWSNPTVCEYTRGEMARSAAGASWFQAMEYLALGNVSAAGALTFNGCFLYDCLQTPIESMVKICGENFLSVVSYDEMPCLTQLFHGIRTPYLLKCFLKDGLPSYYQNQMYFSGRPLFSTPAHSIDENTRWAKEISCYWRSYSARNHQKPSHRASVGTQIQLTLADGTNDGQGHSFNIGSSTTLKVLFNDYANKRGVSLRSLRFSHHGKTLFLSTVGNKTPEELNLGDRDIISVTNTSASTQESNIGSLDQMNKTLNSKKARFKNRPRMMGRRKRKVHIQQQKPVETLENSRAQYSRMLTNLHEELQPRLKEMRDRLNALGLKHQSPKKRKKNKKKTKTKESVDRQILPNPGTRGKAGKSYFIIQVGEIENLHKTKKSCHLQQPGNSTTLDLHGYTKNEALNALNKKLPEWVDTAMKGDYPWVMPVQIVCGCGSQILSETVQDWIKSTRNVINAPKSFNQ